MYFASPAVEFLLASWIFGTSTTGSSTFDSVGAAIGWTESSGFDSVVADSGFDSGIAGSGFDSVAGFDNVGGASGNAGTGSSVSGFGLFGGDANSSCFGGFLALFLAMVS
jgi:hypothetical protein